MIGRSACAFVLGLLAASAGSGALAAAEPDCRAHAGREGSGPSVDPVAEAGVDPVVQRRRALRCGWSASPGSALGDGEDALTDATAFDAGLVAIRRARHEGRLEDAWEIVRTLHETVSARTSPLARADLALARVSLFRAERRYEAAAGELERARGWIGGSPGSGRRDLAAARYAGAEGSRLLQMGRGDAARRTWCTAIVAAMPTSAPPADGPAQRMDALELRDEVQLLRLQLLRAGGQDEPAACAPARLSAELSRMPDPAGDSVVSVTVRLEAAVVLREMGRLAESVRALASARAIASRMRHDYLRVLAEGRLAQAALADDDAREAIGLAQQAASGAQRWPALRYQWEWTAARAHLRSGDRPTALRWYRLAADTLDSLSETGAAPRAYSLSGRLHFELADLLLAGLGPADVASAATDSETGRLLLEARARIERSKVAELRDYFDDECVAELQSRIAPVDSLPEGTAVLYPILFEDRVELLLSLPEAIVRHVVSVGRDSIGEETRRFRALLARRTTRQVLRPAGQLYDWLVRPLERALHGDRVETLIIVPEGPLRLIPMAALHDGERFLVERFALGQTPGLTLTDARQLERQGVQALVAGLTQARSGFPALPNVAEEVRQVAGRTGATVLLDQSFSSEALTGSLREQPFTIVHLASHAQFDADPDATFLLTWDGSVGLRGLADAVGEARFRRDPLELLTLSACETAVGDERSALGFAGAAVGSGARSVLASLWAIDDRASAGLLSRFYAHLLEDGETKAVALRRAQRAMLDDRRYAHPAYWASFVLIGNWR